MRNVLEGKDLDEKSLEIMLTKSMHYDGRYFVGEKEEANIFCVQPSKYKAKHCRRTDRSDIDVTHCVAVTSPKG